MCHLKNEIGINGIKDIFDSYGIDLIKNKEYYFIEKYNWMSDEKEIVQVAIDDDQDIANVLNIPLSILYEEKQLNI
jgi:hypothetical protein